MNFRTKTVLIALILAAAACAGTDANKNGSDVTDLTSAAYSLPPSASVQVAPDVSTVGIGGTVILATNVVDGTGQRVVGLSALHARWQSSDTAVAIVSVNGVVTGKRNGMATITATAGAQTASSVVTVGAGVASAVGSASSSTTPAVTTPAVTTPAVTTPAVTTPPVTSQPVNTPAVTSQPVTTPAVTTPPPAGAPPAAQPPLSVPPAVTPPPVTPPPAQATPTASVPPVITTPPAPSASPSTPLSSTGPGLSGLALISDDFSQYANTAALSNSISSNIGGTGDWRTALYRDGRNAQLASIDPNMQYNGHATLRYDMPGGTSSLPELWPTLPRNLSTLWLRAKIRFGPGFITTGTLTNSSNAYKLLGWGLAGVNGSGRLEITNTTQYDLYWGAADATTGTTVVPNSDAGGGPLIGTEWSDGKWYDYIIEYQITSSTTAVARFWLAVDGQPPVLQMTRTRTAASGFTMPEVNAVMLGMNFNQVRTATQSQQLWYGQWEAVDGVQHPNPFGLAGSY